MNAPMQNVDYRINPDSIHSFLSSVQYELMDQGRNVWIDGDSIHEASYLRHPIKGKKIYTFAEDLFGRTKEQLDDHQVHISGIEKKIKDRQLCAAVTFTHSRDPLFDFKDYQPNGTPSPLIGKKPSKETLDYLQISQLEPGETFFCFGNHLNAAYVIRKGQKGSVDVWRANSSEGLYVPKNLANFTTGKKDEHPDFIQVGKAVGMPLLNDHQDRLRPADGWWADTLKVIYRL